MGSAHDTFARFVDALAACLDEGRDVSTGELAAFTHLSRSQLDRIVSAVAGETPASFRRRVLLERAAHRLKTASGSVLDVAVEAGYSSHEAFTRSFQQAYGTTPSRWREVPADPRLPTPNGVHFYQPGGLVLPPREGVASMNVLTGMVQHHVWLVGELVARADKLPEDVLDRPIALSVEGIDQDPTLRSLLSRLVGQMDMWLQSVASEVYEFDVEDDESIPSMRARLERVGPAFSGLISDVAAQNRFDETFVDTTCDPVRTFTYAGMLSHVLTYAAHRRTLVVGALEHAGAPPVEDDPLAWFAP